MGRLGGGGGSTMSQIGQLKTRSVCEWGGGGGGGDESERAAQDYRSGQGFNLWEASESDYITWELLGSHLDGHSKHMIIAH